MTWVAVHVKCYARRYESQFTKVAHIDWFSLWSLGQHEIIIFVICLDYRIRIMYKIYIKGRSCVSVEKKYITIYWIIKIKKMPSCHWRVCHLCLTLRKWYFSKKKWPLNLGLLYGCWEIYVFPCVLLWVVKV